MIAIFTCNRKETLRSTEIIMGRERERERRRHISSRNARSGLLNAVHTYIRHFERNRSIKAGE